MSFAWPRASQRYLTSGLRAPGWWRKGLKLEMSQFQKQVEVYVNYENLLAGYDDFLLGYRTVKQAKAERSVNGTKCRMRTYQKDGRRKIRASAISNRGEGRGESDLSQVIGRADILRFWQDITGPQT